MNQEVCYDIKNDEGNSHSNNTNVKATSCLKSPIVVGSTIFAHNFLKTQNNQIIAMLQPFVVRCCMHKGKISCIMTW